MELFIGVGLFGFAFACILGRAILGRHVDYQCEVAYVTGHCDGYTKAMHDYQEVPI
jgi:hypothetical protein